MLVLPVSILNLFDILHYFLDQCAQQTFLEDFHSNSANLEVHDANAEHLEIAFTILNDTHGLSTQEFYEKTIEQLKQKYARLTKLRLRGGYVFKTNNPKSSDALKEEIDHLSSTLKSIDKAVNEQGIRLRRLVLTAVLGFEGTVCIVIIHCKPLFVARMSLSTFERRATIKSAPLIEILQYILINLERPKRC